MRPSHVALAFLLCASRASALCIGALSPPPGRIASSRSRCEVRLEEGRPGAAEQAAAEESAPDSPPAELPAWLQDPPPAPLAADDGQPEAPMLQLSDLENTKWSVKATPREDSWLSGPVREQEFTLLGDNTVVWGGTTGGLGTGGRWSLKDGLLEVIRSTPLGLVTGRDYYMANAVSDVNEDLQFVLSGIIRSYNAIQPVMVIADFVATRQPGRFVRDVDED